MDEFIRYEIAARAITRQQAEVEGVAKPKRDAYVDANWRRTWDRLLQLMPAAEKRVAALPLGVP